jgi:hypothetical protein
MTNPELGRLIRKAMTDTRLSETTTFTLMPMDDDFTDVVVSSLGAALVGKLSIEVALKKMRTWIITAKPHTEGMAEELGIDVQLAQAIHAAHNSGEMTMREIASELITGHFPTDEYKQMYDEEQQAIQAEQGGSTWETIRIGGHKKVQVKNKSGKVIASQG